MTADATTLRIETRHGPMLAFARDRFITPCLLTHGELSPGETTVLTQLPPPGGTAVEVGANIGVHTLPLARRCAPGRLHVFEPQRRVFQVLCANLALNDIGNVVAHPDACGAAEGWATVPPLDYAAPNNFGGVELAADGAAGERVRVVTVDSLELETCHLIKIDAEGFEPQVLEGAAATIARCRPRLYVENDRREQQADLIRRLDGMGYRLYWHLPPLEPPDAASRLFPETLVSLNMLCLPKESGTQVAGLEPIDPDNWCDPFGRPAPP